MAKTTDMTAIRKASGDLIETNVDDETIIVALQSGQLYSVKDTSAAIWRMIDGETGRDAIIDALAQEYRADRAEIAKDVDAFLTDARNAGLLAC